ncbi:MAG: hypothetical protein KDK37_12355, partial [Leptospiraceae bacterium]|nr:hypothetical protein [Leptospiraceae bacterium]
LYIGDSGNNKLRKAALSTLAVTTLAGPADGNISSGSSDGSGADARFLFPQHSVSDGQNLYIVDLGNAKIRRVQ